MCEFSLSYGVSRLLQAFVRPPSIPLGLGYAIQRQADKHGVNLDVTPMNTKAATSYSLIVRKLLAMISPDGQELPPLFTKDVRMSPADHNLHNNWLRSPKNEKML